MARTTDEIYAELHDNSPGWLTQWSHARVLLKGAARALSFVEETVETVLALTFRQSSEPPYLYDIGAQHGAPVFPGEDTERYRERSELKARGVTPDSIVEELNILLTNYTGEGYEVRLIEPRFTVVDLDFFVDDAESILLPDDAPARLFFIVLPELPQLNNSYALFVDDGFVDCDVVANSREVEGGFLYDAILARVEELRPHGAAFGILTDADRAPDIFHSFLYDGGGSFISI